MVKTIKIIEYDTQKGVFKDDYWTHNSVVTINYEKKANEIIIDANKEGFIALSKLFLGFAYNDMPKGRHIHLDPNNLGGDLTEKSNKVVLYKSAE